jgi:uncharacterized protein
MPEDVRAQVALAAIEREDTKSGGRYLLAADGNEAEMTFSRVSPSLVIIDHTEVAKALRGTGAGQRLAAHAVEDARAGGWNIMPLCPFMRAQADRHPEWADVIKH